jgi:predicted lipoprotein
MKKVVKYGLLLLVIALVGYKSVYFKKLSTMTAVPSVQFDAESFSKKLWEEQLPARLDSAVTLWYLMEEIKKNPDSAFARYSNAMAIGNYRYSMVMARGLVIAINEDNIILEVGDEPPFNVMVATEYVYGNAIRDASGLLDIRDFNNTSDLNNISEQLNTKVRSTVLPPFKQQVKKGDRVEVAGAVEFNKAHLNFNQPEIIPVRLKIIQ